ncbi:MULTISPECIES: hypothetical protein [unclassified Prochlorococcus]|uniref:hypothetical protein n=1 Tax=unclassified Prochlorococcus TaxID=2627481 RepID=UPI0005338928|nr:MULTISPECIES: hypothetical protein [unclassified Prochlorococcus]KGG15550.1 hypothetical protein EV06_1424 [Prochlorococcus sp. MIT 0602]KGG17830.1 hypothetical protein EV07_1272 [Prochlorococcus sp. MIT 0603]
MNNQLNDGDGGVSLSNELSKHISTHENRVRRLLEMQRRIRGLQFKRNHLKNELHAVEKYLRSLDSQLKSYEVYEQLTFNK